MLIIIMEVTMNNKVDEYRALIVKTMREWRPRIGAASNKRGWDRTFQTQIPSINDVKRARDAVLQDIMLEAKLYGVKLTDVLAEETYISPFEKGSAE